MGEDEGGVLPGKASPGCTLASQIQLPSTGSKSKEGNGNAGTSLFLVIHLEHQTGLPRYFSSTT